jgi:hypothetical protein
VAVGAGDRVLAPHQAQPHVGLHDRPGGHRSVSRSPQVAAPAMSSVPQRAGVRVQAGSGSAERACSAAASAARSAITGSSSPSRDGSRARCLVWSESSSGDRGAGATRQMTTRGSNDFGVAVIPPGSPEPIPMPASISDWAVRTSVTSIATRATHPGGREQPVDRATVTPLTGSRRMDDRRRPPAEPHPAGNFVVDPADECHLHMGQHVQPNLWLLPATDRDYGEIDLIV